MNKFFSLLVPAFLSLLLFGCKGDAGKKSLVVELTNNTDIPIVAQTLSIDLDQSHSLLFNSGDQLVARGEGSVLPVEIMEGSRLLVQVDIPARSSIEFSIETSTEDSLKLQKKTLAELWYKSGGQFEEGKYLGGEFRAYKSLRVPDECTDHSEYIKYEGPGWESDKVGYRIYLDWRNAVDIYGKKTAEMVLPEVGLDGYESYHEMADWGMDILKVGGSLGLGSVGFWNGEKAIRVEETDSTYCEVKADGALYSELNIDYWGWKINDSSIDLKSSLSILAGSRATRYGFELSRDIDNICTGIVKSEAAELLQGENNGEWNYLATWGKQSLNEDNLGMAIFYHTGNLIQITEDEESHVIVLKPENLKLEYYLLAAWELEPSGISTREAFVAYLDALQIHLNHPVGIQIR